MMANQVQWKLLPTKANQKMEQAGADAAREYQERTGSNSLFNIYEAMAAAAPAAPADQHQGEPVAVLYADGTVMSKAECGDAFATCCRVETPLYTHADPAEVERLRADLAKYIARENDFASKMQGAQSEFGAQRAVMPQLLAALRWYANQSHYRASWHVSQQHAMEDKGHQARNALGVYDASAEPITPVERDERAEFEKSYAAEFNKKRSPNHPFTAEDMKELRDGDGYGPRAYLNGQWIGWQAAISAREGK